MKEELDPWDDASILAERLAQPATRLFVVIGAESWCEKCRTLRPQFDQLRAAAGDDELWLWLDLEEHVDFIGDYVPDDLPTLVSYRGGEFLGCRIIRGTFEGGAAEDDGGPAVDPGIRARLLQQDWAE